MKKITLPAFFLSAAFALTAAWSHAAPAQKFPEKNTHVVVIGLIGSKAILRINDAQYMLASGESRDGVTLLGVENQQARLTINNKEVLLSMGADTGGIAPRAPGGSVSIAMNAHGQFITNGQINGRVVEFLVDTGANTVSMTADDARALGIDYKAGKRGLTETAGGVVPNWSVTLRSIKIGPIEITNVLASVRDAPRNSPILLGMTFLDRVQLLKEGRSLKITAR